LEPLLKSALADDSATIKDDDDEDAFEYIEIDDDAEESEESTSVAECPFPETVELESVMLPFGLVRRGDTLELKAPETETDRPLSGDFLRVVKIMEYLDSEEIRFIGQRFRRNAYQRPMFGFPQKGCDRKVGDLNEVFMLVSIYPDDTRPPDLQQYDEIEADDAIGKRELVITNCPYPALSFRDTITQTLLPRRMAKHEAKKYLFSNGRLVCRWVYICILSKRKTLLGGEIRPPYKRECDELPASHRVIKNTANHCPQTSQRCVHGDFEITDKPPVSTPRIRKHERLTIADFFSGAGIASEGAKQAGLKVAFAVEKFPKPAAAYEANHPNVTLLPIDAEDFNDFADRQNFFAHICHFSCPCQYWSPNHIREGKNDLDNIRCSYLPEPIAEKLKPPILTFEQTPGFCQLSKHKFFFREFINSLIRIGYKVRWKIQDLVEFGVPSRRKRLLIIAARKGFPLPPFPRPTHGPPGSGLKPFVTLYEAEEPLRIQRGMDEWHKPREFKEPKAPFNPRKSLLKGVLTTDGGGDKNYHWSGKRRMTIREAAYYQTCPPGFHFSGSNTDAMAQIGNGYPCAAAEQHFLSCAQTLEAFYNGFIGEEEDIKDLWETLRDKGIRIPQQENRPRSLFDDPRPQRRDAAPAFRYLNRLVQTDAVRSTHDVFSRTIDLRRPEQERDRERQRRRAEPRSLIHISDDEADEWDDEGEFVRAAGQPRKYRRAARTDQDDYETLDSGSDAGPSRRNKRIKKHRFNASNGRASYFSISDDEADVRHDYEEQEFVVDSFSTIFGKSTAGRLLSSMIEQVLIGKFRGGG
jgi:DNA (cytosine-5)-methyltransferase 1